MKVFTDATVIDNDSSVIGYVIKKNGVVQNRNTNIINESKISQAELKSIIFAVKNINLDGFIEIYTDSHSIVAMFNGESEPKVDEMQGLMWNLNRLSDDISINYIRSENNIADTVVKSEPIN